MDDSFRLNPNMMLGVSFSSTQADGGCYTGSWNMWSDAGNIKDGSDPLSAADHWHRWRDDVRMMRKLNIQTCCYALDWARIEPLEGQFSADVLDHIREELMLMIGLGIKPLVILFSSSTPQWFEANGGWEEQDNVRSFLIYVEHVVKSIGHLVNEYITLNEPNAYAENAYLRGTWCPGKQSMSSAVTVLSNLSCAHIKAYRLIYDVRRAMGFKDSKVGFAPRMRVYVPKNGMNPVHTRFAHRTEKIFQDLPILAMATGEFKSPLKNTLHCRHGSYSDFHALNYDGRAMVSTAQDVVDPAAMHDDVNRNIYPQGLVVCCSKLIKMARLPIYVVSCRCCDVSDSFRSRFIYDHLLAICSVKLPVKRFYHWSFTDGFEATDGLYARYGLVGVDYETMERSIKKSGKFYRDIIENGGVTQEMYEKYVGQASYHH